MGGGGVPFHTGPPEFSIGDQVMWRDRYNNLRFGFIDKIPPADGDVSVRFVRDVALEPLCPGHYLYKYIPAWGVYLAPVMCKRRDLKKLAHNLIITTSIGPPE